MWYLDDDIKELEEWILKPDWTKRQAVLLLAGILPEDKYSTYLWTPTFYHERFVACEYANGDNCITAQDETLINDALHIIERQAANDGTSYDNAAPVRWFQLFCNEGILNDPIIWQALAKNGINLKPQGGSSIAKYYMKWASKEAWSFHNTVALLCRQSPDDADYWLDNPDWLFGSPDYNCGLSKSAFFGKYSLEGVSAKLRDTIASKAIDYIEVDRFSHIERRFKPRDVVRWAESKGYNYPNLLMEALGYELSTKSSNQSRKKKGCRDEILKEFTHRAKSKSLSQTWEEEISYFQTFALSHDESYEREALKNIIKKKLFLRAKKETK